MASPVSATIQRLRLFYEPDEKYTGTLKRVNEICRAAAQELSLLMDLKNADPGRHIAALDRLVEVCNIVHHAIRLGQK